MSSNQVKFVKCLANANCKHCGKPIEANALVVAVGEPYSMLLHEECVPYYDYSKVFPHDKPLQFFRKF